MPSPWSDEVNSQAGELGRERGSHDRISSVSDRRWEESGDRSRSKPRRSRQPWYIDEDRTGEWARMKALSERASIFSSLARLLSLSPSRPSAPHSAAGSSSRSPFPSSQKARLMKGRRQAEVEFDAEAK